jgi:hypothetical protein
MLPRYVQRARVTGWAVCFLCPNLATGTRQIIDGGSFEAVCPEHYAAPVVQDTRWQPGQPEAEA